MANLNDLEKILQQKLQKALLGLPKILANETVNFALDNFKKQGWQGQTLEPWKPRKPGSKKNTGRALLVDTSRLKRSIRVINVSGMTATVGSTGVPYAAAHNHGFKGTVNVRSFTRAKLGTIRVSTGKSNQPFRNKQTIVGTGTVKAHSRNMNMPRRRFLGYSIFLQRQLTRVARLHIARSLK